MIEYYLSSLVSDGETAEHPGRHAGLGGDVLPAHWLGGGEPLVSIALHSGMGWEPADQHQEHWQHPETC